MKQIESLALFNNPPVDGKALLQYFRKNKIDSAKIRELEAKYKKSST